MEKRKTVKIHTRLHENYVYMSEYEKILVFLTVFKLR